MKKKMKKIKLLFLILLLFLIVGCTGFPSLSFLGKQDQPEIGRGIRMYFLPGAPPTDRIIIGEGSTFLVRVGIDNYGEDVRGELKIWDNLPNGIETQIGIIDAPLKAARTISDPNDPDKIINIIPEKHFFPETAQEFGYKSEDIAPGTKLNIFAELTINNYHVVIPTNFCLKRETAEDVPCSNQEVITSGKLGKQATYAPVTVDRIEKIATPLGEDDFFVDLKIVLKNVGGGEIFSNDREKDVMEVPTVRISTAGNAECAPKKVIFTNNQATINCIIKQLKVGQSYTDHQMWIEYNFPYKMRIKAGPIQLTSFDRNN